MSNFFPKYIIISAKSPTTILNDAKAQWEEQSKKLLSLEFRSSEDILEVVIVSPDTAKEESIFWIEAVAGFPYPCSIVCESEDRLVCTTQIEFRAALEVAMNWAHVRSSAMNMLIWIEEEAR